MSLPMLNIFGTYTRKLLILLGLNSNFGAPASEPYILILLGSSLIWLKIDMVEVTSSNLVVTTKHLKKAAH